MKYELVKTDTKQFAGLTLYRIRALVAIGLSVSAGDLGGYIEAEKNLSQSGNAWVYNNARVSGNARVYGDARVSGNAQVSGDARVSGNAQVYGDARVSGNAWVYGNARVSGNAQVSGDARVQNANTWLLVGPAKSSGRFTTAFVDEKIGVRVVCGCFTGSVLEFSQQIEKTHANNKEALEQYRLFCQLIAFNFGVQAPWDAYDKAMAEQTVCNYCNHPLYAGTKCKNCGRVTEQAVIKRDLTPEQPAQQQQEPVARSKAYDMIDRFLQNNLNSDEDYAEYSKSLDIIYTSPPAHRTWVGLTDEEILAANYPDGEENGPTISAPDFELDCFAKQVEAKLKEKNT